MLQWPAACPSRPNPCPETTAAPTQWSRLDWCWWRSRRRTAGAGPSCTSCETVDWDANSEWCEEDQANPQPGDPPGFPTEEEWRSEWPINAQSLKFLLPLHDSSAESFVLVEELSAPDWTFPRLNPPRPVLVRCSTNILLRTFRFPSTPRVPWEPTEEGKSCV